MHARKVRTPVNRVHALRDELIEGVGFAVAGGFSPHLEQFHADVFVRPARFFNTGF